MNDKSSILISTGEISGDRYGGEIVSRLRKKYPTLTVYALGGEHIARSSGKVIYYTDSIATFGIWEALLSFPRWRRVWKKTTDLILREKPRVVVLIDNPGFNLKLAQFSYNQGIPVIYFIPPQVWAWKPQRAVKLSKWADRILTVFSWEERYFSPEKVNWVGHPLVSLIPEVDFFPSLQEQNNLGKEVVLLPGSRKGEVMAFISVLKKVISSWEKRESKVHFNLISASPQIESLLEREVGDLPVSILPHSELYSALSRASLCVSCSGTVTLEVALMGVPQIIVYHLSSLTYFFARWLVKPELVGLPNIVLEREICPELIQRDFSPYQVSQTMEKLLNDSCIRDKAWTWSKEIREKLSQGNTFEKVTQVIGQYISER